jgi:uncharacterized membrane protein
VQRKIEIKRVDPISCGIYVGLLMFFFSFIDIAHSLWSAFGSPMRFSYGVVDILLLCFIPFVRIIFGIVLGIVFSLVYNLLARKRGLVLNISEHSPNE